jgi:hypothetical protein
MKKLIFNLLSYEYKTYGDRDIVKLDDSYHNQIITSISKQMLQNYIVMIVGITAKQSKWYIKAWIQFNNKNFNFNNYWNRPNLFKVIKAKRHPRFSYE